MLQDPITALLGDLVDGNDWSVTVLLTILKASLFVVVVLRSLWMRSPSMILMLLSTRMIVVVCLIPNKQQGRGIVSAATNNCSGL